MGKETLSDKIDIKVMIGCSEDNIKKSIKELKDEILSEEWTDGSDTTRFLLKIDKIFGKRLTNEN